MPGQYNDPYLQRWSQPDTIVPSLVNPQSMNHYSYVVNDPLIFTDPDGHAPVCNGDGFCLYQAPQNSSLVGFTTIGYEAWTAAEIDTAKEQFFQIAVAYANAMNEVTALSMPSGMVNPRQFVTPEEAFYAIHKGAFTLEKRGTCGGCWAENLGNNKIAIYSEADIVNSHILVHEVGHQFFNALNQYPGIPAGQGQGGLQRPQDGTSDSVLHIRTRSDPSFSTDPYYGYIGRFGIWQHGNTWSNWAGEERADMFVGWVYGGAFSSAGMGAGRRQWVDNEITPLVVQQTP
jgi:hypothetical protein